MADSFTADLYRDDESSPRCPVCGVGPYESISLAGPGDGTVVATVQPCGCALPMVVTDGPDGLCLTPAAPTDAALRRMTGY